MGIPVYLDDRTPELQDPSREPAEHEWQAADPTTSKLTRCLEAVRDVSAALSSLTKVDDPEQDKRPWKVAITPVYNLAEAVRELYNEALSNGWSRIVRKEQITLKAGFEEFLKAVPTEKGSILRTARDQIASHIQYGFTTEEYRKLWESFGVGDVLRWTEASLILLNGLLNPDIYAWTRPSGFDNVDVIMNVDSQEVSLLIEDGEAKEIVGHKISKSPKYGFLSELLTLHSMLKEIGGKCKSLELPPST
jgi:hypothetical protein